MDHHLCDIYHSRQKLAQTCPKEALFSLRERGAQNDSFTKEDKQFVARQTFTSHILFKIIYVIGGHYREHCDLFDCNHQYGDVT